MGARAFHPKPPRNRGLNEAWAGNILPFPRKSPDFFWSPYPRLTLPSLSIRPLAVSFRSSSSFLFFYTRSRGLRSSLLPSSSFVSRLLRTSLSFSIFLILFSRINSIRHFFMCVSLFLLRCEISAVMNNSIMIMSSHNSLHRESYTLFLFYTAM